MVTGVEPGELKPKDLTERSSSTSREKTGRKREDPSDGLTKAMRTLQLDECVRVSRGFVLLFDQFSCNGSCRLINLIVWKDSMI